MARITSLEVENMYRIKAVQLKFSEENGVFIIGGRNEQGKSSTIDSLWSVLKGKGALKKEPVHKGADEGHSTVTLDNGLIVTRRVRPGGWTDIKVESEEGAEFKSPQAMLNKLFGEYLDPVELSRMKDKELQKMLEQLAGLDYTALDERRAAKYNERALVNKEQKRIQAQAEGMEKFEDVPSEIPSTTDLVDQIEKARKHNTMISDNSVNLENLAQEIKDIERDIEDLRSTLTAKQSELRSVQEKTKELGQPVDTEPLREQLKNIEDLHEKARANAARSEKFVEAREKKNESEELTTWIQQIDAQKAQMLADANLPVDGLTFSDEGVLYGGVPIEQESTSGRLKIFTPMLISMLPADGVRLLFIRDGNCLDDENLKLVTELAERENVQVIMERVTTDPSKASVIIEDGMVAEEGSA